MSRRPDGISESIRIRVHPGLCEAWGSCHRWAPDIYPRDADGKVDVHVIEVHPVRSAGQRTELERRRRHPSSSAAPGGDQWYR
jgi:hypothetical protein